MSAVSGKQDIYRRNPFVIHDLLISKRIFTYLCPYRFAVQPKMNISNMFDFY